MFLDMGTGCTGEISKSYLGNGQWVPAVKAGKSALRARPRSLVEWHKPLYQRGLSAATRPENAALTELKKLPTVPSGKKNLSLGTELSNKDRKRIVAATPKKIRRPVAYHDASSHFGPYTSGMTIARAGSKKPAHSFVQPKSPGQIIRHEFEHSQPRRSYHRLTTLQKEPRKLGQEEGRADARMIRARGRHEPVASDYELHSVLTEAHRRGNQKAAYTLDVMNVDDDMVTGYDRIRRKLKVPNRTLDETLPRTPKGNAIRQAEPGQRRGWRDRLRRQIGKSYLGGGKFAPASTLKKGKLVKIATKPHLYTKDRQVTAFDRRALAEHAATKRQLAGMVANQISVNPFGMQNSAVTMRVGSKSHGHGVVYGQATSGKLQRGLWAHENQHATPKRSSYRLHQQIGKDPAKLFREEARADFRSQGHYKNRWNKTPETSSWYSGMAANRRRERRNPRAEAAALIPSRKRELRAAGLREFPSARQVKEGLAANVNTVFPHYNLTSEKRINRSVDAYRGLQDRLAARSPGVRRSKRAQMERRRQQ